MPQEILPSYTWSRQVGRYRSNATGRFVARRDVLALLDAQINSTERRIAELTTAYYDGDLDAAVWQSVMRDDLRRLYSQQAALGHGGWDRMDAVIWGMAGGFLADSYRRMTNLAHDIRDGNATLAQALQRVNGYVGTGRHIFWEADRGAAQKTGLVYEERRRLGVSEHCPECLDYAAQGWVPMYTLPPPGDGSRCNHYCKCTMERREVKT